MKKNLNIAYLNGAEGMIRRGASGGSGSGGEASTIEYLDVSGLDAVTSSLVKCVSIYAKGDVEGQQTVIMPTSFWYFNKSDLGYDMPQYISFVAIDSNASVTGGDFTKTTIKEYMVSQGVDIDAIPRITKEEFYSLE